MSLDWRVPERVLVAHGAVEPPLRDLVAGGREMHRAEFLIGYRLAPVPARKHPNIAMAAMVAANRNSRMMFSIPR